MLAALLVLAVAEAGPSLATSGPLRCGTASVSLPWQSVPIPAFPTVQGVSTADAVQAAALDSSVPSRVLVSNGTTIEGSSSDGCAWRRSLTLDAVPQDSSLPSGASARIRALALLPTGRGLAAVQDGTGSASRLLVLGSDDPIAGGYTRSDSGLPPQGVPAAIAVSPNGSTVYLALHAVSTSSGGVPPLPGSLGGPASPGASGAGLLYASTDGGRTWAARLTAANAAASLRDITALAVGGDASATVYAIAGGTLALSRDGGRSFATVSVGQLSDARSLATSGADALVSGTGGTYLSVDAGRTWSRSSPLAADAVALRPGDSKLALVTSGQLELVDRGSGAVSAARPAGAPSLLLGDSSRSATFHAVTGHLLLRYVDITGAGAGSLPPAPVAGDTPPPPPLPGVLAPASLHLKLPRGGTRTVPYTLQLPADPTPLNVLYLVDVSSTLQDFQSTLNSSIRAATSALTRRRVAVRVGIGTLGTGPSKGKPPYPDADPVVPHYSKPTLYHLLRGLGPVDAQFYRALGLVRTETLPSPNVSGDSNGDAEEGQLLALDQAVNPRGVLDPNTPQTGVPVYSVPGGQQAGFVNDRYQRNVIVTATDEYFANPAGSPDKADGSLDFDGVISRLRAAGVAAIGLTMGTGADDPASSFRDLARVARGTGAIAPAGGIRCSAAQSIPAGQPIVCTDPGDFGSLLTNVLSSLRDVQALTTRVTGYSAVVQAVSAPALGAVDVTKSHTLPALVTFSCAGQVPGVYTAQLHIGLRGFDVGVGSAVVDCTSEAAPPPARTLPAPPHAAAAQPNAVVPAVPAPPAVQPQTQPQSQPQTQTQVQQAPAAALQQQRQLQLALALQPGQEELPDPAFQSTTMAMVDRRRDEHAALGTLAIAMLACTAVGLARLRTTSAASAARSTRR